MKKQFYTLLVLVILILVFAACAPSPDNENNMPSSEDQVATIVAGTLQALTPVVRDLPEEPADILPHRLYYLGRDGTGLLQVFRMERDGSTTQQITFEPVDVNSYDVSPIDGSVAYVANNQLLSINADGSNRSMLVDGGPVDPNDPLANSLSNPVFSADGQSIVYGQRGVNLYSIIDGIPTILLPQQINPDTGLPGEFYWPKNYSPDGTKLLVTTAIPYSDGISTAIFFPATNSLIRLTGEGAFFCCSEQAWTSDSSAAYAANPTMGMFGSGLWRVDGTTGVSTTMVQGDAGDGLYNLFDEPYPAPDGQLYYFFAKATASDGIIGRSPLQLVRSAMDGITGRAVILDDNFQLLNEALWAPDASFVIVAFAPTQDVYVGGQAEITYLDGRPSVILTTFAQDMKWGP